jgi:hypothetical protein
MKVAFTVRISPVSLKKVSGERRATRATNDTIAETALVEWFSLPPERRITAYQKAVANRIGGGR